ncbi:MAG TPA: lytic transglycosylase domain-containing protein [Ktedonobacteraceae bacterium]|jgi:soluble lytic murein transglycosylase-like protein|nr:lytic transglycosylase domain-containing protein [Ktedonobacteraceae bacterium]
MNKLLGIVAVVVIVIFMVMTAAGPGSRVGNGWQYLTTGSTTLQSGQPQVQAAGATDYHALARQDAIDNHIDPDLFERQIAAESAFNPNAQSVMGARGIAQIMPATAAGWHVNAWDPTASLSAAAKAMAWYQNKYGSFEKALACYNAGTSSLDTAMAQYGADWKIGLPAETQTYIKSIMRY